MKLSFAFIETRGLVAAIEAADAMLKAAKVEIVNLRKIDAALVTVTVRGELAACQAAVDAGQMAAQRIGQLISAHVIPNPYPDTENQISGSEVPVRVKSGKISTKKKAEPGPVKKGTSTAAKEDSTAEEKILIHLKGRKKGSTLDELSDTLSIPASELRILLKKLMDSDQVEKIRQHYFFIDRRGRR